MAVRLILFLIAVIFRYGTPCICLCSLNLMSIAEKTSKVYIREIICILGIPQFKSLVIIGKTIIVKLIITDEVVIVHFFLSPAFYSYL